MNWEWVVSEGLISGNANWYDSGQATADEYDHAVQTAYNNATSDEQRKKLVDMLWSTGAFEGNKEHWYTARPNEVGDLGTAAQKLAGDSLDINDTDTPRFGLPGGAELWKDEGTGESYLVYVVPGTEDDPVYMRWTVESDEDLQSFFGPDQPIVYNRELQSEDNLWADTVDFGGSTDLKNTSKSPFDSWVSTLDTQAKTAPWILDDDYQQLLAMAILEDRVLTEAEIATTKWYQTHNDAQRDWMDVYNRDPMSAQQQMDDRATLIATQLREAGMADADPALVEFMAQQVSWGNWTRTDLDQQVRILTDPYFQNTPMDQEMRNFIDDQGISYDQTSDMEVEVRNTVQRWLGTNFGSWDDATVANWAAKLRNDPDALEALTEQLKDQKQALFPGYDRESDYESIASPWRSMMRNSWGEVANDSDKTLHRIIQMNDAVDAGEYLTREGLSRGNETVVNDVQSALYRSLGGTAYG